MANFHRQQHPRAGHGGNRPEYLLASLPHHNEHQPLPCSYMNQQQQQQVQPYFPQRQRPLFPNPNGNGQEGGIGSREAAAGGAGPNEVAGTNTPSLRRGSSTVAGSPADGTSASPSPASTHNQLSPTNGAGTGAGPGASAGAGAGAGQAPRPIRRRMRMITSCLECRRRKLKCNKAQDCHNCLKFCRSCVYFSAKPDEASQMALTEMKEKMGSLERQLERDVAKSTARGGSGADGYAAGPGGISGRRQGILADDVEDEFEGERDLEPTPMAPLDLAYEDDGDGPPEDLIDLGIQVGRMRITERIGGMNRPRIAEEIGAGLSGTDQGWTGALSQHQNLPMSDGMSGAVVQDTLPDFLRPGASYIAPTGGFFFGQVLESPSIAAFLPQEADGDRLIHRYFVAVHPIARCVHRASFEALYDTFKEDIRAGFEPRASTQAVVFAALFSAAVSLDEGDAMREFRVSKSDLVTRMKLGTESALSKADFLRTTKIDTLQAFVMFLIPLCREEVSRAHSVLVGAAVRMAECMGLHRDGEAYGLSPLEREVRRFIWHQLCFLDVRTCEAQGPKPAIRREDYDTKLPLNYDEDELARHTAVGPVPVEGWTSNLLSIIRFEINEMMRMIWFDRRKLETRRITLTAVLNKVENFRKRMTEKYSHYLEEKVPIQLYTKLVMSLLTYRLHAMVLHPYHSNTSNPMPERLNHILVMAGVNIIEAAIQLDGHPFFRDWRWYLGAYQQYQIALLLATEIYYRPASPHANRIWACLDYVFDLDPNTERTQKSMGILREIQDKSAVYMRHRKMRAPTTTAKAAPDKQAVKDSPSLPGIPSHPASPPHAYTQQLLSMQQQGQQLGLKAEPRQQQQQHQPRPDGVVGSGGGMGAAVMALSGMMGTGACLPPPQHNHYFMANMQQGPPMVLPPQNMVFGGASNGEALWGLPPGNPGSPGNSSEGGSPENSVHRQVNMAQHPMNPTMASAATAQAGNPVEAVDWGQMDLIFSPEDFTMDFNALLHPLSASMQTAPMPVTSMSGQQVKWHAM